MLLMEWECLGHRMLLKAEVDALTGCKWAGEGLDTGSGSPNCDEETIIEIAKAQISEYLDRKRKVFNVPIRMEGTEFRKKVWNELLKIPYGTTITYKELAQRIGSPDACRAVANACGANPLPILIPCHRVISSDGKIGGYTGGLGIKEALLSLEKNKNGSTRVSMVDNQY